jgi:hypothetical protein
MTEVMMANGVDSVVQNDTEAANDATVAVAAKGATWIAELEEKRVAWEEGVYRTSNQALYEVLARCYAAGGELSVSQSKQRRAQLEAFYKERGYKWKTDIPLLTQIVRAVFGSAERRRISTYSLVLRQAKKMNVMASNLAQWIDENGGVQEIKLSQSATYVKPKEKAKTVREQFADLPLLATVKNEQLSILADSDNIGDECVLLAQQQADGSFEIRAVLRSGGVVTAALAAVYAQQKEATKAVEKERKAANDADGALGKAA